MKTKRYLFAILAVTMLFVACQEKQKHEEFKGNNKAVLKNWAENIIIPAYTNYQKQVNKLVNDANKFNRSKNAVNFNQLKNSWLVAYKAFQKVILFDFGKAESINLLGLTNTYPTNVDAIEKNINLIAENKSGEIDLAPTFVVKKHTYQGFPALDYLLFHTDYTIEYYQSEKGKHAASYIVLLTNALQQNINKVVSYWNENKNTYINNTDNSVTGAYASTINAFLRGYEKEIRAAKVGYAAGAIKAQSNKPAPKIIEAYYNGKVDKELLEIALRSSQDFFNGKHFQSNTTGKSLSFVLDSLGNKSLTLKINQQYSKIYTSIANTPKSLKEIAVSDNAAMRKLYDVIQVNVAYYKTQMMATLKVQVGYQDSDGD